MATKSRRQVFNAAILNDLKQILADVCKDFEAQLVEFDGEAEHIHLLVNYPPKIAVSKLVNSLKGVLKSRPPLRCNFFKRPIPFKT